MTIRSAGQNTIIYIHKCNNAFVKCFIDYKFYVVCTYTVIWCAYVLCLTFCNLVNRKDSCIDKIPVTSFFPSSIYMNFVISSLKGGRYPCNFPFRVQQTPIIQINWYQIIGFFRKKGTYEGDRSILTFY